MNIFSFLKKNDDEEQVREMLRIADWCASQFGSEEFELLTPTASRAPTSSVTSTGSRR
ncbi:hypothetical protein [Brachybacterium sp. Z12]|uniref:hypothetical protein n=1 Tax=Brachybacterium sp. Z12 TaxID=2759167 RepID=UPI00223AEAFC|nr:hypothetical protein [Brachybacterium sp. Z12]